MPLILEKLLQLGAELNELSVEFSNGLKDKHDSDDVMAAVFLKRQNEYFSSVLALTLNQGHYTHSVAIIVSRMIETMAHLYYSDLDKEYSKKWVAYQYIDKLRLCEQKILNGFLVTQEEENLIMDKLKEHCVRFVKHEYGKLVRRKLEERALPKGKWFHSSWGGTISYIIDKVSDDIDAQKHDILDEHTTSESLRYIYHKWNFKSQMLASESDDAESEVKWEIEHASQKIELLIAAIDLMIQTVDIANRRFQGNELNTLQSIVNDFGCIKGIYQEFN